MQVLGLFIPLVVIGALPATSWALNRYWRTWRRFRLSRLVWLIWIISILPLLVVTGIAMVESIEKQFKPIPQPGDPKAVQLPYRREPRHIATHPNPRPFKGTDYATHCGDELVAPQDGWVETVGFDGFVGPYGSNNSYVTFLNEAGTKTILLHGRYIVERGQRVVRGKTVIGYEASIGNSTGCHTDFWSNGQLVAIGSGNKPLRISWYDPSLCPASPINCWGDGSTFRNGEPVTAERYGDTAACIEEWLGRTVVIPELGRFTCRDTGGAIKEHPDYIWIDILARAHPGPAYVSNWYLED